MELEQINHRPSGQSNMSFPYLIYAFSLGFMIIAAIIHAGYQAYSFWLSLLIGSAAQTCFRLIKRIWLDRLNPKPQYKAKVLHTRTLLKSFGFIYLAMLVVSAFWYAIGFGAAAILSESH